MHQIQAQVLVGNSENVYFDEKPQECPLCHHAVDPKQYLATLTDDPRLNATVLEILYQCTRRVCARMFIGRYVKGVGTPGQSGVTSWFALRKAVPEEVRAPLIPTEIEAVSPDFKKIYTQAKEADARRLDEIAGVGYRKALEFLIKDYCIRENPTEIAEISKQLLGPCIARWVTDPELKECATRAAWLGNDETHYLRKWATKDIEDLKILIELTMNWIHSKVLSRRYLTEMPK